MNLPDAMIVAGLCTAAGGIFLTARIKARIGDLDGPPGGLIDLVTLFVWVGILLVQASSILLHKQSGGLYNISALTWAGSAAALFVCGCVAGRLTLRLEIRRYRQKREDQSST